MTATAASNYTGLNIGTLILIAVAALITVIAIIWGSMRRRAKAQAVAESERHDPGFDDDEAAAAPSDDPGPIAVIEAPMIAMAPMAAPVAAPVVPPPVTPPSDTGYPLTTLKGLGPRAAAVLASEGIASVADLAALDDAAAAALDGRLGALAGRIARDRWVEQARLLTRGDTAAYEAAFGKLGG